MSSEYSVSDDVSEALDYQEDITEDSKDCPLQFPNAVEGSRRRPHDPPSPNNWPQNDIPLESRDQYDEAEAYYNDPLRVENRALKDEVLALKKLLRENAIPWNSTLNFSQSTGESQAGSSSGPASSVQKLPTELNLKIIKYALTAKDPIIDPLCKLKMKNLSTDEQKERKKGPHIAIGLLAVSKEFYTEGTRVLWTNNEFVFTTPTALRLFAEVPFKFRSEIKHITLRIVAHYYDDEKRTHIVRHYPRETALSSNRRSNMKLRVTARPKDESTVARAGFRSYTWTQVADFLKALQSPFDPGHDDSTPRPRLLPFLKSMRMDFVCFPAQFLPMIDLEFHSLAFHDLGSTLDELMVTGLPGCPTGEKVLTDLTGMVKDDGLLLTCLDTFVTSRNYLRACEDSVPTAMAVRTWKEVAREWDQDHISNWESLAGYESHQEYDHHFHNRVHDIPVMPPATKEEGHPESEWKERKTIWKRIPMTRDSHEREWVEFDRIYGTPVGQYSADRDVEDVEELICKVCGIMHDPSGWEL